MAIKVNGVAVIDNGRNVINVSDATIGGNATFTGVLTVPVGNTSQRAASPGIGQIRFNTEEASTEIYDGSEYVSVGGGGTLGSVPFTVANGTVINIPAETGDILVVTGRGGDLNFPLISSSGA